MSNDKEDAFAALTRAATGQDAMARTVRERRGWFVTLPILLGCVFGGLVLIMRYGGGHAWVWIPAAIGFAIAALGLWYASDRTRQVSPLGWNRDYQWGLGISLGFYVLANVLINSIDSRSVVFWLPYAVLTAVPLLVVAVRAARR